MSKRSGQSGQVFVRNGRYVGRFYVDTPERRIRKAVVLGLKSEMTKPEAKRRLLEMLSSEGINAPTYLERALGSAKTFNEVADKWEQMRLPKLGQSSQYMNPKLVAKHLRPFFGTIAIDEIKTGMINEWISIVMKDFEPKTVHNMYKLFRAIVNWYYRQEDQQPRKWSPDLPPLKDEEQRWFAPEETSRIVGAATGQFKVLFHLAASTGCRAGELFGLRVEDIDFERRVIKIVRSVWEGREVPTKTRKGYREVFIDSETANVLREHLAGKTTGRVFETRNGTPFRDGNIVHQVLYPLCDALGIKRGGMHAFRHGRVSMMRVNGVPDDLVKRQIGHSSLKTTSGYTHFSEQFQRELAEKVSWTHSVKLDSLPMAASSQQHN
jgi:integrase